MTKLCVYSIMRQAVINKNIMSSQLRAYHIMQQADVRWAVTETRERSFFISEAAVSICKADKGVKILALK